MSWRGREALTDKQAAFVREYLVDLNATQAAIRAGYSEKTARSIGHENLTKPDIEAAIQAAKAERATRTEITADRVLEQLGRIAFADLRDLFTWDEERACFVPSRDLTEDQAAVVKSVEARTVVLDTRKDGSQVKEIRLKLKAHDKIAALREIGKHLGVAQKIEHSGSIEHTGVLAVPGQVAPVAWNRLAKAGHTNGGGNGAGG